MHSISLINYVEPSHLWTFITSNCCADVCKINFISRVYIRKLLLIRFLEMAIILYDVVDDFIFSNYLSFRRINYNIF